MKFDVFTWINVACPWIPAQSINSDWLPHRLLLHIICRITINTKVKSNSNRIIITLLKFQLDWYISMTWTKIYPTESNNDEEQLYVCII
jgi:hypothetical protein